MLTAVALLLPLGCAGTPRPFPREYPPVEDTRRRDDAHVAVPDEPPESSGGRLPRTLRPTSGELALWLDPAAREAVGSVTYHLEVAAPTRFVVLHARALGIGGAVVHQGGREIETSTRVRASTGGIEDELVVALTDPLEGGPAELTIDFTAPFDAGLRGLYRVESEGHAYVGSKFEPTDARHAFPCFDEPGTRIPYRVQITAPVGLTVLSNAPVASSSELGSGEQRVTFAPTPPLPSYLVAFAVGPYVRVDGPTLQLAGRAFPIGAYVPPGHEAEAGLALDGAAAFVREMTGELGELPDAKLDLVAVPGYPSGATEHPGLITFRDNLLLLDADARPRAQRRTATLVAHEVAHLWFGDHLGIAWWDALWLKEGLASYYETRLVDAWQPELGAGLAEEAYVFEAVRHDRLPTAREVVRPIRSSAEAISAYDPGVYSRAAAILRMLEAHATPRVFRDALAAIARQHAGTAIDEATFIAGLQSAIPEAPAILQALFHRPGIPTVRARCDAGRLLVAVDDGYRLPIRMEHPGGTWEAVVSGEQPALTSCPITVDLHPDGVGYYATRVSPGELLGSMARSPTARERMQVVLRAEDLAFDPDAAVSDRVAFLIQVLRAFEDETEPVILEAIFGLARRGARLLRTEGERRQWAESLGRFPLPQPTAPPGNRLEEARFDALIAIRGLTAARVPRPLLQRLRREVEQGLGRGRPGLTLVAAREGESALIDRIAAALEAPSTPTVRSTLLTALGQPRDPALLHRALDVTLRASVRTHEVATPIAEALQVSENVPTVLAWIREHWEALLAKVPTRTRVFFATALQQACDGAVVGEHEVFVRAHLAAIEGGEHAFEEALATAQRCVRAREGIAP